MRLDYSFYLDDIEKRAQLKQKRTQRKNKIKKFFLEILPWSITLLAIIYACIITLTNNI